MNLSVRSQLDESFAFAAKMPSFCLDHNLRWKGERGESFTILIHALGECEEW